MEKSFSQKIARIISTLFVPPSFSIIIFTLLAIKFEPTISGKLIVITVALALGFIAPIILFVTFKNKGKLVDLDASIKEERTLPFLISTGFYLVGLLILIFSKSSPISIAFWFCYISNTLIVIYINKYWKISVHAMGASGPLAVLLYIFGIPALSFLIIILAVDWSRIKLKCHNLAQVTAGSMFGFISTYSQIYIIVKLIQHAK